MFDEKYIWTADADKYLLENYMELSYRELGENLNRSEHGIRNRLKILKASPKKRFARWSDSDDMLLEKLYKQKLSVNDIGKRMGRSACSVRLRATRILNAFRNDRLLRTALPEDNFYYNLKRILTAKTAKAKCCICGYSKHIDLHHKDGNRKNHHQSNISSLCPNCHREVEAGEHEDVELNCIWWRVYSDGTISEIIKH